MGGIIKQTTLINDNLFLGGETSSKNKATLKEFNIQVIVNVSNNVECVFEKEKGYIYKVIPIADVPTAKISSYFDETTQFIHTHITNGKNVLVHCKAGASRSATMVIAYLMKYNNLTLKEAFLLVKERRKLVHPNIGFWKQLVEYEKEIYGVNTVNMLVTGVGPWPDILQDEL